jgi:hypothetical protein
VGDGRNKLLLQTIARPGIANEKLTLSAWGRASRVPAAATFRAELIVYNGSAVVLRRAVNFPKGTAAFTRRSFTVSVPAASTRALVKLSFKGAAGTAWLDDVSLMRAAP